jgi:hypothetical protein
MRSILLLAGDFHTRLRVKRRARRVSLDIPRAMMKSGLIMVQATYASQATGDRLLGVARIVREETQRYALETYAGFAGELSQAEKLGRWCGEASVVLVAAVRSLRLDVEFVCGRFRQKIGRCLGHCWAVVGAPPPCEDETEADRIADLEALGSVLDVTATQFHEFAKCPIVHLPAGHSDRRFYLVENAGAEAMRDCVDAVIASEIARRVGDRIERSDLLELVSYPWDD